MFGQPSMFGQAMSGQNPPAFGQATSGQNSPVFSHAMSEQNHSPFGQATSGQNPPAFGQASLGQNPPTFGQASLGQNLPAFGQASLGQKLPAFGQASLGQNLPAFGQASLGQNTPAFGQASLGQNSPAFGQASLGQNSPAFGQASLGQNSPAFGQASLGQNPPAFGQASLGQNPPAFGQASLGQNPPAFGQASLGQNPPTFGQASLRQNPPAFGQAALGQSPPAFGQAALGQSPPAFGQAALGQSPPAFGQAALGQSPPAFGQAALGQSPPAFGQAALGQSPPAFGQAALGQSPPAFGQAALGQNPPAFGQAALGQKPPAFGQAALGQNPPAFGQAALGQNPPAFGQAALGQNPPAFGQAALGQKPAAFGQAALGQNPPAFGQAALGQNPPAFGQAALGQNPPAFGQAALGQNPPAFGQAALGQNPPAFGQAALGQNPPAFGQAALGQNPPAFGQAALGQNPPAFGQAALGQNPPAFGQAALGQNPPAFGQAALGQNPPAFGQAALGQNPPAFGQAALGQNPPAFGQAALGQNPPAFGQAALGQNPPAFGQAALGQNPPAFGQAALGQNPPAFGQAALGQNPPAFGQAALGQNPPAFGQAALGQNPRAFGQATSGQNPPAFGQATSGQNPPAFGQATSGQNPPAFGQATSGQNPPAFGQTTIFGQVNAGLSSQSDKPNLIQSSLLEPSVTSQSSLFGQVGSGQSFGYEQMTSQTPLFGQAFAKNSLSEQETMGQSSGFGQVASGASTVFSQSLGQSPSCDKAGQNSGLVSKFGEKNSGQPPSYGQATAGQTSTFGAVVSTQPSVFGRNVGILANAPQFGETSGNKTVFGKPQMPPPGFSGQFTGKAQPFTRATLSKTESEAADISTSQTAQPAPFQTPMSLSGPPLGQVSSVTAANIGHSFQPSQSATFKPIFGAGSEAERTKSQKSMQSFTSTKSEIVSHSAETQSGSSLPLELKKQEDFGPPRPLFASSGSSFASCISPASSSGHSHTAEISESEDSPKGVKRKDEAIFSPRKHSLSSSDRASPSRSDHSPDNRPSRLARPNSGGANLLVRSLYDVLKSHMKPRPRREPAREEAVVQQQRESESDISLSSQVGSSREYPIVGPSKAYVGPSQQVSNRVHASAGSSRARNSGVASQAHPALEENAEPSDITAPVNKTPLSRAQCVPSTLYRAEPLSPNELTAIQVKNLPRNLNQRQVLEKHFNKYGKVQRVYCKPARKLAVVHFSNHNSAVNAKKMAKMLHKDVSVFWQKKKTSPGKKQALLSQQEDQSESFLPPSLSHLLGTQAETSEEKYRLLDQRDKSLRQARVKRTDLDQAKVFVGTCPDMCPEKERYMRETRNQLSMYELLPGTDKLNHAAAIKEYSRSSADQEEPLPHELRPTSVLNMTMDYLVTCIMDQGEGNCRDWYDFVWNRTRSIRKDITQQQLCDLVTVSLMEKCMRFHIHCAHQLCEEPMSSFDAKINIENLTKCLQSLKEMYEDLHNQDVFCPNEPEFRGYSVLLSLNKGDILREVQQFNPSVRNSAEVKFAVQVFAALNSTNYVRFFRLTRSASYLNSCILHCYFSQIRQMALRALNVAYTASAQRCTSFPLENVVRLLLFHDSEEATDFLITYGLNVSEGFVELSRTSYLEPDLPAYTRKCSFIIQKRLVSVGEVVNGAPLPQFSLHVPVSSFDAQNKYIGASGTVELGLKESNKPPDKPEGKACEHEEVTIKRTIVQITDPKETLPFVSQSVFQPIAPPDRPPSPPKTFYCDEDISAVVEELVAEHVRDYTVELKQTGAAFISAALEISSSLTNQLLSDVVSEMSYKVAREEVTAETERVRREIHRKAEEAKMQQERERFLSLIGQTLCQELVEEVLNETVCCLSGSELQHAVQVDHHARVARCSQHVYEQCMSQFLEEETVHVATESLHEMQCCNKYLQRWREKLATRKKLRRQMRGFPAAPGSVGCDNQLRALIPSAPQRSPQDQDIADGIVDLGHAGKRYISTTRLQKLREETSHKMKVLYFYQKLLCEAAWAPLKLSSLIARSQPCWKECVFWKLVIALPGCADGSCVLSEWLKAKFCGPSGQGTGAPELPVQTLALYSSLETQEQRAMRVHVCVKVAHGPLDTFQLEQAKTQRALLGTCGFVFLLPKLEDIIEEDVYWLTAELQLKQLLQAKPFIPAPPLAILVRPCHCPDSEVEEGLKLQNLISYGLVSKYIIVSICDQVNDMRSTNEVFKAVEFLLSHCPPSVELCRLPLQQYIEDGVQRFLSDPFYHDMCERRKAHLSSQGPSAVIDLYNTTLSFLAEVVSSEQLSDLSWPVAEFTSPQGNSLLPHLGWNCPKHLAWLKKAVLSFQIPQLDVPPPEAPWLDMYSMILEYVCQICTRPQALPVLLSEVKCLLHRTYSCWRERADDMDVEGPAVKDIPWDDVLALCINHKLRDWDSPPTSIISRDLPEEMWVYFMREDLKKFIPPDTWIRAQLGTHRDTLSPPDRHCRSPQNAHVLSPRALNPEEHMEVQMPDTEHSEAHALSQQLKRSLQAEHEESRIFTAELEQRLSTGSVDLSASLRLPVYLPEALLGVVKMLPVQTAPPVSDTQTESAESTFYVQGSLTDRIQMLHKLIQETKQADVAHQLHLETLLEVGDQGGWKL